MCPHKNYYIVIFRAVYQNKDIYFIDDIFSAVDVPVGMDIYNNCIMGLLKDKTRILCTHHPKFLASANRVNLLLKAFNPWPFPAFFQRGNQNLGGAGGGQRPPKDLLRLVRTVF